MIFWLVCLVGLGVPYLFGSIPTAYLAGRLLKGIDIREHGSKSVGATNALRTLGKWPGLVVLLVDALKGTVAIFFVRWLYVSNPLSFGTPPFDLEIWLPWAICMAGLAALLGHSWSIWLEFSGGKSAATGLGILLAMSWPVGLGTAVAFATVLTIFRIVSLGSMLAALTAIILVYVLDEPFPYQLLVTAGGIYVSVRHRANIRRLLSKTEPRIGQDIPEVKTH